ncbi:hypothetical protein [Ruminococcus flavefaciens]|uniref:hypothetical protein n=1 Tax=Ruminococcus flavefaciens TaxID=1265 RepID=UPI0002D7AA2A|nr:hypothetical protein [Ruminococcus flavefaciens]
MKNTLKKITASIAAAVLCAVPMASSISANAAANANARFTYRKVFAVSESKNIDLLVFGVSCRTANTSAPSADKIASGSLTPGGGGNPGVYNGGGNFRPSNRNMVGGMVSVHMYCNSPSDYKELSTTNYAYDANGNLIADAVSAGPTFLVGDLNLDKKINSDDYQILYSGIRSVTNNFTKSYKFSYFGIMNVVVGNVGRNYSPYSFDINNDGYLSKADTDMFMKYLSNSNYRFAK